MPNSHSYHFSSSCTEKDTREALALRRCPHANWRTDHRLWWIHEVSRVLYAAFSRRVAIRLRQTDATCLVLFLAYLSHPRLTCHTTQHGNWRCRGNWFQKEFQARSGSHSIEGGFHYTLASGPTGSGTKWWAIVMHCGDSSSRVAWHPCKRRELFGLVYSAKHLKHVGIRIKCRPKSIVQCTKKIFTQYEHCRYHDVNSFVCNISMIITTQ